MKNPARERICMKTGCLNLLPSLSCQKVNDPIWFSGTEAKLENDQQSMNNAVIKDLEVLFIGFVF